MFDSAQLSNAYAIGSLEVRFNPNCVIMHGPKYGALTPWNKEAAHAWDIVGWPRGHLILEAQSLLMRFLRTFVDILLDGYTGEGGCGQWHKTLLQGAKTSDGQEFRSSYNRQAFSAPARFNPMELLELAQSRLAAGEDELELLQTGPAYTLSQINALLKLDYYKELAKEPDTHWRSVAHELTTPALFRAQLWTWITQELTYVCQLHERHGESLAAGRQVQEEYALVLGALQRLLLNIQSRQVEKLHLILHTLPHFQHHFEYTLNRDGQTEIGLKQLSSEYSALFILFSKDPLWWAIHQLQGQWPREVIELNKSFYFNFIDEHLAKSTTKEKGRIDQRTYNYLADMAGVDTILTALQQLRPFILPLDGDVAELTQGGRGGGFGTWRNCLREPPKADIQSRGKEFGSTMKIFFNEGWPKGRKDGAWLAKADQSRLALSNFWKALRKMMAYSLSLSTRAQEEIDYELSMTEFALSPSHLAKLEEERNSILQPVNPSHLQSYNAIPHPGGAHGATTKSETVRNAIIQLEKAETKKRKKRKEQDSSSQIEPNTADDGLRNTKDGDESNEQPPREQIVVSKRALRIFDLTFGATSSTAADVPWQDFTAALVEAGCSATQNSGSAVTFKLAVHGSIVFHRPHPDPTVDPVICKLWARG